MKDWLVWLTAVLCGLITHLFRVAAGPSGKREGTDREGWDLDRVLFGWSEFGDFFRLRNATESVLILGELGAAKTTASLAHFLLKYLELGMGGLYCCVKPGDRALIEWYATITGRKDSLIIVSPDTRWRCNLIRYLLKRPGMTGSRVEQITSLLMTIVAASERGGSSGGRQNDKFWERSTRQLIRNAVELCIAARQDVTMSMIHEVITTAPLDGTQVHDEKWQKASLCYKLIEEAEGRGLKGRQQKDYEHAARYFLREFPAMPNDTRGSILATYGVLADVLLRGHMADLFDGDTNFVPEVSFEGAVVVLDLPIKVFGQAGAQVQSAFCHIWQTAAEQRDLTRNPRVTFWAMDEAHELVNEHTSRFLATARQSNIASLLISQNLSNLYAAFGENGRDHVEAIVGNTGTKVLHANGHLGTNEWASQMISQEIQLRASAQGQRDGNTSPGVSENFGQKVLPAAFTMLKKGGKQNGFVSDALVFQTGASFTANQGEPFLWVRFRQHLPLITESRG